jgi:hypothetical protein
VTEPQRNGDGVLVLARRMHVTYSKPGTTHGAYAHHVVIGGVTACSGVLVADETFYPLANLSLRERCQRRACKARWSIEPMTERREAQTRRGQQ